MKRTSNFFIVFFLSILFFIFGVLVQKLFFNKYFDELEKNKKKLTDTIFERKFTNPILDLKSNFYYVNARLESVIAEKTAFYKKNRSVADASIYFSHLNNNTWYGINEKTIFNSSGLNKILLLISAFKLIEESPEVLNFKFLLDEASGTFQKIDSADAGNSSEKTLTIYDVMEDMIKNSNNKTATFLNDLLNASSPKIVERVFIDLGIKMPNNKGIQELTAKDYAVFFSVLYNVTYINDKNSEMALKFLSETAFKDGLNVGLDENTLVAHYYEQTTEGKLIQMHNCGIIYYPGSPYILCILIKGYDANQMNTAIQEISKAVFQEVKTQVPTTL